MVRAGLIGFCLLAAVQTALGQGSGQARYRVTLAGKLVGSARLSQRINTEGSKQIELVMELSIGPEATTIRSQSWYDTRGFPMRKVLDIGPKGKAVARSVIASFDPKGASIVVRDHGVQKTPVRASLASNAPWGDPSEFWVLRDKPKAGTKLELLQLNLDTLQWERAEVTYRGKTKDGHRLSHKRGLRSTESVLDENGLPIRIEDDGGLLLIREP